MTTKVKSSATSRKGRKVSESVNASDMMQVVNAATASIAAPAGAGVTAGGASPALSAGSAGVPNKPKAGKESINDKLAASLAMGEDYKITELRSRIASHWAAPEWSGAAALRAVLAGAGLTDEQINAAVAAAARKSGEDLNAQTPTITEVCDYINTHFAKEFRNLCGCAVPVASAVRCYSYSALSVSTITADSNINDYLVTSAVPAGLSASGLVAAIMSVRVLVDIRRRFAAARAAARNDFRASMAAAARRAGRLGLSAAVAARYFSFLLSAVPAADASEEKRLRKNLAGCWAALKQTETALVLAAPAGAFGAVEIDGGFVFPASLPASASAKCRKLWAKRVRLLSSIDTLNALLARC